jgi:hypothetical protein
MTKRGDNDYYQFIRNLRKLELASPEALRDERMYWWEIFHNIYKALENNRLMPDYERDQLLSASSQAHTAAGLAVRNEALRSNTCTWEDYARSGISTADFERSNALVPRERVWEAYELAYRLVINMRGTPLEYAKLIGDRAELARQIRNDFIFSDEVREYIAAIVEGSIPARQQNRHKSAKSGRRDRTIVWFILRARANGVSDDKSVEQAVNKFALGRRAIQKIFAEGKDREPPLLAMTQELLSKLQALARDMEAHRE